MALEQLWLALANLPIPIIATLIASITAIVAYHINARINRREALVAKRREVFADYVKAFQLNISGQNNKLDYSSALAGVYIYGTDDVIRRVAAFHRTMADKAGQVDTDAASSAYIHMIIAMRKDCYSATKLDFDELKKLLPFI